jgi:type I restriction enzyme S subunit
MESEWDSVLLGDVVDSCLGKMLDKKKNKGEFQPYLGNSNVRWGSFELDDLAQMKFEPHEEARYRLKKGDLIVCEGGEPGRCALWDDDIPDMKIQKALHRVRPYSSLRSEYLFYWFLYNGRLGRLEPYFTGTTIKHLTGKALAQLPIKIPPLEYQDYCVKHLKKIDEKIRLNQQTNQTLEQMAQTLFKSWFVDFDPVIDNALAAGNPIPDELQARAELRQRVIAERATNPKLKPLPDDIQQLFPSEFEESELGWIPKGWSLSKLGELIDFATGPAFKSKDFVDDGVKLARGDNVKEGFFHWGTKARYWPSITSELEKYSLAVGDILIGMDGSKVGKNWVQVSDSDLPSLLIQRVARLRSKGMIGSAYLSVLISSDRFKNYVDLVKTGTSIPHISGGQIKSLVILNPNDNHRLFQKFEEVLAPFSLKNSKIKSEIITLISLRDTLLPKLISGEIQLDSKAQEPFNG